MRDSGSLWPLVSIVFSKRVLSRTERQKHIQDGLSDNALSVSFICTWPMCNRISFIGYLVFIFSGPVALNWIVVTGDEYAAQRMLDRYVLNMCPNFVADGKICCFTAHTVDSRYLGLAYLEWPLIS